MSYKADEIISIAEEIGFKSDAEVVASEALLINS
jgi:hypothetical protein